MTEDEMVEWLADMQRLSRELMKTGAAKPYDELAHGKAADAALRKLKSLAVAGDVI